MQSAAEQWLWGTRGIDYKGICYPDGYQTRLRYQQFNRGSSANWLGNGYPNKSNLVLEAQRALAYLGYNPWGNQDGIWGPTTESAVRRFQANNSTAVDGIVGQFTWGRLASYGKARI
ncbi:MAG TPA: hypothetical protein DDW62_12800 [Marinilabiliaceae bacterium]|nr:hypothetical protein [Marinilabiliaceae bacterium]